MLLQFVKTNILSKKLRNFLTIFSILISVMLIISVGNLMAQLKNNVVQNAGNYSLVVGAPGSDTQLILSTIFYYDNPIANINISYMEKLEHDSRVAKVVPIGMGDNYNGYRIIGTSEGFFEEGNYVLKDGKLFGDIGEVVLGSTVAKVTGLKVGDKFSGMHGLTQEGGHSHDDFKYTVVGILEASKTPSDTVLYTNIESLWKVHGLHDDDDHEHEEETTVSSHGANSDAAGDTENLITALLVKTTNIANEIFIENELNGYSDIQAINPAKTLRKLLVTLNTGEIIVTLVAYVSIFLSIIVLFTTMLSASVERRKDISILRALGANRKLVLETILLETMIIAIIGAILGFLLSHIAIGFIGNYTAATYGINISAFSIQVYEIFVLLGAIVLSVLAGIIPAVMVYKTDATKYLK